MATDSSSNGTDSEQAIGQATFKTNVHPFFKPLSAKRTSTSINNGNSVSSVDTTAVERKRPKQNTNAGRSAEKRTRRSNAALPATKKAATIQSFFATKSTALPLQTLSHPDRTLDCQAIDVKQAASEDDRGFRADIETDAAFESPRRPCPMFRSDGIPVPYPLDNCHIPAPLYESFIPRSYSRAEGGPDLGRFDVACAPASLEAYTSSQLRASSDGGSTEWRQFAGDNYIQQPQEQQQQQQQRPRALSLASSNNTALTSLGTTIGNIMPHAPPHLQFIERMLDALRDETLTGGCCHTQLLTTRYRPLRARDVLGNRRAVIQLQSWIESMRLTRSMPSAANNCISSSIACDSIIDARAQSGHSHTWKSRGRRQPTKARRRNHCSTHRLTGDVEDNSNASDNSDSSDDFMPTTARSRRRAKDADGLRDVLAWAQCDGTLLNVREKARRTPRHRRSGSESGTNSDIEQHSNIILLEGPSGSCKTAAVYACASECGFEVREIHPGERRSGKDVLAVFEDVILSHTIGMPAGAASAADQTTVNQVLILIEHVDVLFEQDQRLWPALKQLAQKSRRPIVLTCNDMSCIRWNTASFHLVLSFRRPDEHILVPYCFLLCVAERALVSPADIARVCQNARCDLNQVLNHLDFDLRQSRAQSPAVIDNAPSANMQVPTVGLEDSQNADLSKMLAWMCGTLGPEETPQTRYQFWLELVHSAQATTGRKWPNSLPDPPALYPTSAELALPQNCRDEEGPPKGPVANQNTFFGRDNSLSMAGSKADIFAQAIDNQATAAPIAVDEPLTTAADNITTSAIASSDSDIVHPDLPQLQALSLREVSLRGTETSIRLSPNIGLKVETEEISNIAQLEAAAASLDLLSLATMTNCWSEYHDECLREPLHTFLSPMVDGCLGVDYVVLEADTLTRNNPALLPDSIGVMQSTGACINEFLVSAGGRRLGCLPVIESYGNKMDASFTFPGCGRPLHRVVPERNVDQELALRIREAIDLVGVMSQRLAAAGVVETAAYLSHMVRWDWVHQGKIKTIAQETKATSDSGDEHIYRIGTRRTRQRTYRAHIKHVPAATQGWLVDWIRWWKHNE
ncbi:hypothetical protein H4R20_001549 [Coemansia guatemalensis]|uniref:ATPase AAA-type core domain-containing protein n=1 Tax=Coemansia guatemalensis TaxID=2761395 RepID=A0A9W8HX76_9FUNG|nr:hypothetical protein H4R20_001549 [Coemansia guatemalensis]